MNKTFPTLLVSIQKSSKSIFTYLEREKKREKKKRQLAPCSAKLPLLCLLSGRGRVDTSLSKHERFPREAAAHTAELLSLDIFQAGSESVSGSNNIPSSTLGSSSSFLSAVPSSPGQTLIMVNCVQSGWLLCCPEWGCSLSRCLKQVREPFSSNQQHDEEAKSWIRTKYCRQKRETGQQLRKPNTLPGSTAVG